MAKNQSVPPTHGTVSHGKLVVVIAAAALVVVLAFASAFVWPGWALNKTDESTSSQQTTAEPTKPTIQATKLPDNASQLLKAMPDSVLNYARTKAKSTEVWSKASPLEEYTLTYSTGTKAKDVKLTVAQWSDADTAKKQYDSLTDALQGKDISSGNVKVSGKTTGSYVVRVDADNAQKAVAVWQNDTVVFQVTGAKDAVKRFYPQFPL